MDDTYAPMSVNPTEGQLWLCIAARDLF